jgi:hypothetical protein
MVFPIVGGTQSTGYDVDNSLRINAGDSAFLSRTQTAGNQRTFTVSAWVKRARLNDRQALFSSTTDGSNECFIWFDTDDELFVKENTSNSTDFEIRTNRKFRDPSAWYHIVVAYDTTNSTSGDRVRIYVNGVEETSFANETQPSENFQTKFNKNSMVANIGRMNYGQEYLGGYLAEIHWLDGVQYDPTYFGEFDDNGVWIPKKYTGGNYGTNGYYLQFQQTGTSQNASGIGADTSGQDNHFAVTNLAATDITEDTCTNNFATFNPLFRSNFDNDGTFLEGNCQRDFTDNANRGYGMSTIGVTSGKWYWEIKVIGSDVSRIGIGVGYDGLSAFTSPFYDNNPSLGMHFYSSASVSANGSTQSYGSAASANDIFMYALDMDNHLIWLGVNGSWFNSATVTEIQNSTATNDITTKLSSQTFLNSGEPVFPMVNDLSTTGASQFQINFGNPPFSISSGNNDGKYGNFEYAPPSGYYALCTKRLAEFG